jgi:hypothetical protein
MAEVLRQAFACVNTSGPRAPRNPGKHPTLLTSEYLEAHGGSCLESALQACGRRPLGCCWPHPPAASPPPAQHLPCFEQRRGGRADSVLRNTVRMTEVDGRGLLVMHFHAVVASYGFRGSPRPCSVNPRSRARTARDPQSGRAASMRDTRPHGETASGRLRLLPFMAASPNHPAANLDDLWLPVSHKSTRLPAQHTLASAAVARLPRPRDYRRTCPAVRKTTCPAIDRSGKAASNCRLSGVPRHPAPRP